MHEATSPPPRLWWHRRAWQQPWWRWRRWLYALVWPLALALLSLSLHLYLANRAVVLWAEIQTLRAENWQLWWDIQTLAVQYAQRQQQALETLARQEEWQWPDPSRVLYLEPPSPTSPPWEVNTWTLPPVTKNPATTNPQLAASRSLWDQLWLWWDRHALQGRRETP